MMDVNAAVATMVASGEKDDAGEGQGGGQHGGGDTGRLVADSSGLDALEEGDEGVDVSPFCCEVDARHDLMRSSSWHERP